MQVGVPREVKSDEGGVALTPGGADELGRSGHEGVVQGGGGEDGSRPDAAYTRVGATIGTVDDAWGADLVLKVKEPQDTEFHFLRPDLILFTYLHLAAERPVADALVRAGTTAIAYETVEEPD